MRWVLFIVDKLWGLLQFPEMFFNQVLEQAQPDAIDIKSSHVSCTVGPLVHLNQYATWATTFNSAELPTGLSSISEGDDFKISALNVTFWGGPDPAAAQQVIRQAAEESRRDFVSCEELSELQKWPEVLFDALPTKESILTAAAGIISDGSSTEGSNNPSDRSSVVEQQRSVSVDSDRAVSPENVRTNTNSTLQTKVISAVSTSSSGSHDVLLSAPGQSVKRVSAVRDGQTQDSKRSATGEADDRPHETEGGGKGVTVGVLLGACFGETPHFPGVRISPPTVPDESLFTQFRPRTDAIEEGLILKTESTKTDLR